MLAEVTLLTPKPPYVYAVVDAMRIGVGELEHQIGRLPVCRAHLQARYRPNSWWCPACPESRNCRIGPRVLYQRAGRWVGMDEVHDAMGVDGRHRRVEIMEGEEMNAASALDNPPSTACSREVAAGRSGVYSRLYGVVLIP